MLGLQKTISTYPAKSPCTGWHLLADHADVFLSVCGLCTCVICRLPGKAPCRCKWEAGRFLSSAGGFSRYRSFCERCCDPAGGFKQQKRVLADIPCWLHQRPARSVCSGACSAAGYADTAPKSKESPNVRERDAGGVGLGQHGQPGGLEAQQQLLCSPGATQCPCTTPAPISSF